MSGRKRGAKRGEEERSEEERSEAKRRRLAAWRLHLLRMPLTHCFALRPHRFVQATPPFNTITNLGSAAQQLVVIPMEEYKKKPNVHGVHRGVNKGLRKFSEGVAVEGANTISKVSKFIANKAAEGLGDAKSSLLATDSDDIAEAGKAASRGLRSARNSITMIPDVKERKGGWKAGMLVPIAVVQAGGGGAEAVSVSMLALRNKVRPDLRKEDRDRRNSEF